MCLINLAFQQLPSYPFVLVGNRDEFYDRPTAPLQWWKDAPVLAGRDLKEGGTWMGMNTYGDFVAITNYRDLKNMREDAPSRGLIASRFLNKELPPDEMHRFLRTQGKNYNGFNILYGNAEELYYYNNVTDTVRILYPGIYGLSNAFLDTPWPKVTKSKTRFSELLSDPPDDTSMLNLLHDTEEAQETELPDTGVSPAWEKKLSAMFITSERYGTRLTTFVSINNQGKVLYREKGYVPAHDLKYEFNLHP